MESVNDNTAAAPAPSAEGSIVVPTRNFFELQKNVEKRAYIESFAIITGKVRSGKSYRCKGCGEYFAGPYLAMIVHMAGTHGHLSVRARKCRQPIMPIREKILEDFKHVPEEKKLKASVALGKRKYSAMSKEEAAYIQSLPLYENCIVNRAAMETASTKGSSNSSSSSSVQTAVSEYYSQVLQKSSDLQTNCCTTSGIPPLYIRQALGNIHDDVLSKYYGCGFLAPALLKGMRVLDLGCGSGRDVYVLAQMVGESGTVVGVDMTEEQLSPARRTQEWHRVKFGYAVDNTQFLHGYIEKLGEISELGPGSFDIIVSNCVVNLSPDKVNVLKGAYTLLKPGGEVFFSDVYCTQRIPLALRQDPVLWGECLSGALYWNDFLRLARGCGFSDPRLVSDSPITIDNPQLEAVISKHMLLGGTSQNSSAEGARFYSATYRLFKIRELEPDCEDYGQAVMYLGTIPAPGLIKPHSGTNTNTNTSASASTTAGTSRERASGTHLLVAEIMASTATVPSSSSSSSSSAAAEKQQQQQQQEAAGVDVEEEEEEMLMAFDLDDHHHFPAGKVIPVCGNTYRMLFQTRFRPHFRFFGAFDKHFGIFSGCGKDVPFKSASSSGGGGGGSSCC